MTAYQNPVIRGYHPDPSVCRVGEDFYLVTSTFEFFPGIPVFHSKDLVNWTLINYCLTEDSQLDLEGSKPSGGLYAPTIRYHDGVFYVICTNTSHGGNFIVHTKDIRGEWSEPHWVQQDGIDPSLFFDEDGSCWFCNTHNEGDVPSIGLFAIDPMTGKQLGERTIISTGSGGRYPEAPHIYKMKGCYYLMLAEGGTEYGHMVTLFRSKTITGPYEPCPHNPILSHRNAMFSPIQATGHADLFEDQNHNWWMVCLGIRPLPGTLLHNLGRETFLTPVVWDKGWPTVGNNGTIALSMEGPLPAVPAPKKEDFYDDFPGDFLRLQWNYVRNPRRENYRVTDSRLLLTGAGPLSALNPTFAGVQQTEFCQTAETEVQLLSPKMGDSAGLTAFYNSHYYCALTLEKTADGFALGMESCIHGIKTTLARKPFPADTARLRITADWERYTCMALVGEEWQTLGDFPTAALCTEGTMMMTFTGTYWGLFAEKGTAAFEEFAVTAE